MTLKSVDALSNVKSQQELHEREIQRQALEIKQLTAEKYDTENQFKSLFRLFDGYKTDLKFMTELKNKIDKEKRI